MATEQDLETPAPVVVEAETCGPMDPRVVIMTRPSSAAAEQYRLLGLRLEAAARAGKRRIAITSAIAGEGRTLTAVNTALALGRTRRTRVALVDCNFRAPAVHRLLGLEPASGLVDVLEHRVALEHAMWRFDDESLWVVPAGVSEAAHEVAGSRRLGETLAELGQRTDVVLIDAPPMMPTADMSALARYVDGVVLVVRAGRTPRELVEMALEALGQAEVEMLGCVLVGIEAEAGTTYRLCAEHDRRLRALPARSTVRS